jgi:uncharacterized RDD family membrane protein YckC
MHANDQPRDARSEHRAAGVVTRFGAMGVDMAVVIVLGSMVYVAVVGVRLIWSPTSFTWPEVPFWLIVGVELIIAVLYLTVSWAVTGRSYGDSLLGLRVLPRHREFAGWGLSLVRAAFCVAFPFGLVWVVFSPDRRSLQDVVLRTVVVYDWGRAVKPGPNA